MNKAVLVMDMPDSCFPSCPLRQKHVCSFTNKFIANYYGMPFRPEWCPLKSLPRPIKKERYEDDYAMGLRNGFNNCLSEIEELGD